jgi:glycosyltransferase involved in cell wall biosynthesis
VSVIIPHFDRSELLRQTVESVLRSSRDDFEIIVVDDGSSSHEWEQVQQLRGARVRIFRRGDGSKGPSRCRNIGFAASRAEFVIFLDSDDLMAPWCIADRLAAQAANPDADAWVFPVLLFQKSAGDQNILWNTMDDGTDDRLRFLRSDPPWQTSSPMWRRGVIGPLGPFDENLSYGDDSDFHLRALLSGVRVIQFENATPDVFIRRSDSARITNSLSPDLIEARRTRLSTGTEFLKSDARFASYLGVWEGQYFVEAEFLLFNTGSPADDVTNALDLWERDFSPSVIRRSLVRFYFKLALLCRAHAYLLLRLARRAAMLLLPSTFFPTGGNFNCAIAPTNVMNEIDHRMRRYSSQ